jgi:hypothetical protein
VVKLPEHRPSLPGLPNSKIQSSGDINQGKSLILSLKEAIRIYKEKGNLFVETVVMLLPYCAEGKRGLPGQRKRMGGLHNETRAKVWAYRFIGKH